ncbi:MAG: CPBP family intramembrane metalloprotease, partial [Planctomycetaceae bacterium]|nr:CPBP family intramembrane metalloprotease [Planctomycetaceae bacterium]
VWLQSTLEIGKEMIDLRRRGSANEQFDPPNMADANAEPAVRSDAEFHEDSPMDTEPVIDLASADPEPELHIVVADEHIHFDLEETVASGETDLSVQVEFDQWSGIVEPLQDANVTVYSNKRSAISREAERLLEERLAAANLFHAVNVARRYNDRLRLPVRFSNRTVESTQQTQGFLGLLPLALLLMTVTGGVYPAIDLTAGERERDTLETLIALPIPTVHLLMAKYIAVFVVTMLTGAINLVAMTATVYALRMETQLFGSEGISLKLVISLLSIQIVFALFYSAVLLAITSTSRSFKEAQAFLIPLMLISIAPGLSILLPGWHLSGAIAVVPLVNMLLLARDVFEGNAILLPGVAAVASTLIYAASALALAAKYFGRDAMAVGSRGSWADLFRRPESESSGPTFVAAMLTLATMFPLYFFANGLLGRSADAVSPNARLLFSGTLTVLLFAVYPAIVVMWQRFSFSATWPMLRVTRGNPTLDHRISLLLWPFVAILGVGTWPWIYELVMTTQQFGLAQLDPARLKQVAEILERWRAVPLALMIICLGVLPGVCEELFFRGFLLSGLKKAIRPWMAIIACGTIFGVFHVIAAEGATLERLLPSTALGCLLSWIAIRSGSVLPGLVMHVLHNSTLLALAHFRDELANLSLGDIQAEHLPTKWLATSALCIVIGIVGVWSTTRVRHSTSEA